MPNPLEPSVPLFAMNGWLFDQAIQNLTEDKADQRLDPSTNEARGIALHLLAARHGLAQLLGADVAPLPWTRIGTGTEAGFAPGGERPPLAAVLTEWKRIEGPLAASLQAATPATLSAPSPIPIPGLTEPTLHEFAQLNVVHESYHIGQLGLLAKAFSGQGILRPG